MAEITATQVLAAEMPWLKGIAENLLNRYFEQQIKDGELSRIDPATNELTKPDRFISFTCRVKIWCHVAIQMRIFDENIGHTSLLWLVVGFHDGIAYLADDNNSRIGGIINLAVKPDGKCGLLTPVR